MPVIHKSAVNEQNLLRSLRFPRHQQQKMFPQMVSTLLTNLDLPGYLENTVQCNQRNKGLVTHTVTAACHKNLLKHCNSSLAASQWSLSCLHLKFSRCSMVVCSHPLNNYETLNHCFHICHCFKQLFCYDLYLRDKNTINSQH